MGRPELRGIRPDWPAPPGVHAFQTTREGGVSRGSHGGLNLALHCGDDPGAVRQNRERLRDALSLPAEPSWMEQVHGATVAVPAAGQPAGEADAAVASARGIVLAVLTADCLPVLLCDSAGSRVAAVHAGWRGLAAGVLEAAIEAMAVPPSSLIAWLGPAIGQAAYEVGPEVRDAFTAGDPAAADAFARGRGDRWHADLCTLARARLAASGVGRPYGGDWCTMGDAARFFSYRRDGVTGRMAALIWLA